MIVESKKANKYFMLDNSHGNGANKNLKTRYGDNDTNSEKLVGIIFSWNAIVGTFVAPSVFFASRYSKETLFKYSDVIKSFERRIKPNNNTKIKLKMLFLNSINVTQRYIIGSTWGRSAMQNIENNTSNIEL